MASYKGTKGADENNNNRSTAMENVAFASKIHQPLWEIQLDLFIIQSSEF